VGPSGNGKTNVKISPYCSSSQKILSSLKKVTGLSDPGKEHHSQNSRFLFCFIKTPGFDNSEEMFSRSFLND